MSTWLAPVPKSIKVSSIESVAKLTAPVLTLKCDDEKLAIPLFDVVASSAAIVKFGYVPLVVHLQDGNHIRLHINPL